MDGKYILLLAAILLFSCGRKIVEPANQEIKGFWRYVDGIDENLQNEVLANSIAYISITPEGNISGFTSTNYINGIIMFSPPDKLAFENMSSTKVPDSKWSGAFHQALLNSKTYELGSDKLKLVGSADLEFSRIENCKPAKNDLATFNNGKSDSHLIKEVNQVDNCLEIIIQYGGGCKPVELDLIGTGNYAESYPVQLNVRTVLKDDDSCEAAITKGFYFDMEGLRYEDSKHQIILNFKDSDISFKYSY